MKRDPAWLAALLKPRDLAVHANFESEEIVEAPNVLASLVAGDFRTFSHLVYPDPVLRVSDSRQWVPGVEIERDLVFSAQRSLSFDSQWDGANELRDLCLSAQLADPMALTATAILAAVAYAESDDYTACLALVDQVLDRVTGASDDERLCQAVLHLQRGLRVSDSGKGDGSDDARHAYRLLKLVDPFAVSSFRLSLSVGWTSSKTAVDIHEYLIDNCRQALTFGPMKARPAEGEEHFSWQDRVRSSPPQIALLSDRRAVGGYERLLDGQFKARAQGTAPKGMVFGEADRGDAGVFASQLADEVSGRHSARSSRLRLAQFRLAARGDSEGMDSWETSDLLRLLRHSGSPAPLRAALKMMRAEGPLEAVRSDAMRICERRLAPDLLREPELRVLHLAADLLNPSAAAEALAAVLEVISVGGPADVAGRWSARSAALEPAWLAACALAAASGASDSVARRLLQFVQQDLGPDSLLGRAVAQAMRELDWESVSAKTRDAWRHWAMEEESRDQKDLKNQVLSTLRIESSAKLAGPPTTLEDVAQVVDSVIRGGSFPEQWRSECEAVAAQSLRSTTEMARKGSFGGGGISAADVAVGLALHARSDALWPEIAEFLTDVNVQRGDTSRAFDRLAASSQPVPASFVSALREAREAVLFRTQEMFGETHSPYPAALRCFARLGIVDGDELLELNATLAGEGGATGRHEAAQTVTAICRSETPPPWARVSALHLSWDPLPEVRAESARSLALLVRRSDVGRRMLEQRLCALLREQGLLVPVLALRGLNELGESLSPDVLEAVRLLNDSHPSRIVRELASGLVSSREV